MHQVQMLQTGSGWGSPRREPKARWDDGGTAGLDAYLGLRCWHSCVILTLTHPQEANTLGIHLGG